MFITLVLIFVFVLVYLYKKTLKPKNYPPGPKWHPFTGSAPEIRSFAKQVGGIHKALHAMSQEYNSTVIGLKFAQNLTICVHGDKMSKEILTRDEFQARPTTYFSTLRSFGTNKGITFTNGELWKIQRRFVVRHLREVGLGKAKMDSIVANELDNIIDQVGNQQNPKISGIVAPSVLNVIWSLVAGERLNNDDAKLENLLNLMEKRNKWFDVGGGWLNLFPWLRFIAPKAIGYELISTINKEMQELFMGVINEHTKNWYEGRNDDVIYAFITEMNETRHESFTADQLVMICVDLFFGGATATSKSLDFSFFCMLRYPDVQKKVHECIDSVYQFDSMPHYKNRHLLPYVEAVVLEVMRYYLPTPISGPRVALKNCKVESYDIPEGTTILINNYSSNHDPKIWKDPQTFRPERFLNDDGQVVVPKYFYPFNLGKRKCPAEALARSCIFTFFAGVMKTYEISLADKSQNLTGIELPGITISPEPHKACFRRRYDN